MDGQAEALLMNIRLRLFDINIRNDRPQDQDRSD